MVRLMKSACAAGYNNVGHRSTSSLQRKGYLFFFKIFNSLDWLSWESVTEFNIILSPKHTKKKLLHKSHQLLRNSIFGSQKLLCKILTVNSSLKMNVDHIYIYTSLHDSLLCGDTKLNLTNRRVQVGVLHARVV